MINLYGMDKDFNTVCVLAYNVLQWRRRFFESGSFSVEIPLEQYNKDIVYLYTPDRAEIGKITQVNYYIDKQGKRVNLSGYFMENELNKRVVFRKSEMDECNAFDKAWNIATFRGKAEEVATALFYYFGTLEIIKNGVAGTKEYPLDIILKENAQPLGKQSEHTRNGERLGDKMYKVLKPSNLSYRVALNTTSNTSKKFMVYVYSGKDRSADSSAPVVFSTRYGNITNIDFLIDTTEEKNAVLVTSKQEDTKTYWTQAYIENESADDLSVTVIESVEKLADYTSETAYKNALKEQGRVELENHRRKISFDFDACAGSYEYLTDFDLGDICTVAIPEINIETDAILTGINETIKKGVNTISLQFDIKEDITT